MTSNAKQASHIKLRSAESVSSNRSAQKKVNQSNRKHAESLQRKPSKQTKPATSAVKQASNITTLPSIQENREKPKKEIKKETKKEIKMEKKYQEPISARTHRWEFNEPLRVPRLYREDSDTSLKAIIGVAAKGKETQKKKNLKEIMRHVKILDYKIGIFKDNFRTSPLFNWNCKNPYRKIDKTYRNLTYMEKEEEALDKKVDLFKLHCPLKVVKKELRQAKRLWDLINIVMPQLAQMKKVTKNYGLLEFDCNQFKDDLRKLDNLKGTNAYDQFSDNIEYMLICIITVSEIRDAHLRENLWKELMNKAKVN